MKLSHLFVAFPLIQINKMDVAAFKAPANKRNNDNLPASMNKGSNRNSVHPPYQKHRAVGGTRALQEVVSIEEEIVLPTAFETQMNVMTYANQKFGGHLKPALQEADLDNNGMLDERETKIFLVKCMYFANGGDLDLFPTGPMMDLPGGDSSEENDETNNRKLIVVNDGAKHRKLVLPLVLGGIGVGLGLINLGFNIYNTFIKDPECNCCGCDMPPDDDEDPIEPKDPDEDTDPVADKDPHFVTFQGHHFGFHGVCDLVLVSNPSFADGAGLDIQVRTSATTHADGTKGSIITHGVVKIGNDKLEVSRDGSYLFNGVPDAPLSVEVADGKYTILDKLDGELCLGPEISTRCDNSTHFIIASKQVEYYNDILHGENIFVTAHHNYIDIWLMVRKTSMEGSSGLWGTYPVPAGHHGEDMFARDGETNLSNDHDAYGQEWQVDPTKGDTNLFHELRNPQAPEQACRLPAPVETNSRLLRLMN